MYGLHLWSPLHPWLSHLASLEVEYSLSPRSLPPAALSHSVTGLQCRIAEPVPNHLQSFLALSSWFQAANAEKHNRQSFTRESHFHRGFKLRALKNTTDRPWQGNRAFIVVSSCERWKTQQTVLYKGIALSSWFQAASAEKHNRQSFTRKSRFHRGFKLRALKNTTDSPLQGNRAFIVVSSCERWKTQQTVLYNGIALSSWFQAASAEKHNRPSFTRESRFHRFFKLRALKNTTDSPLQGNRTFIVVSSCEHWKTQQTVLSKGIALSSCFKLRALKNTTDSPLQGNRAFIVVSSCECWKTQQTVLYKGIALQGGANWVLCCLITPGLSQSIWVSWKNMFFMSVCCLMTPGLRAFGCHEKTCFLCL